MGSVNISGDSDSQMLIGHELSVEHETSYCVGPFPSFPTASEKEAHCPGSASAPPSPANTVTRPSIRSTSASSLITLFTVGALISNKFRSVTKVPGSAKTSPGKDEGVDSG